MINDDGTTTTPILTSRIKNISKIKGLSLMMHADGDNHSGLLESLSSGGAHTARSIISK